MANQLSLNVHIAKCIHFKCDRSYHEFKLVIDGIQIEQVQVVTFLGILIDDKLTWKCHINRVSDKVSKSIGILYEVRNTLSQGWKLNLYKTYMIKHLYFPI